MPEVGDLHQALLEAQKIRGSSIELPWQLEGTNLGFTLTVCLELGTAEPVWTLYQGRGTQSYLVWSAPFGDVDLLKDVISLTMAESMGTPGSANEKQPEENVASAGESLAMGEQIGQPVERPSMKASGQGLAPMSEQGSAPMSTPGSPQASEQGSAPMSTPGSPQASGQGLRPISGVPNWPKQAGSRVSDVPPPTMDKFTADPAADHQGNSLANENVNQPTNQGPNYYAQQANNQGNIGPASGPPPQGVPTPPYPYGYYYPGYPYPYPYPYPQVPPGTQALAGTVPLQSALPMTEQGRSQNQASPADPELYKKQTKHLLGEFLVESGLIPQSILNAALKLQEMARAGLIASEQVSAAIKRIHLKGGNINISDLINEHASRKASEKGIVEDENHLLLGDILLKAELIADSTLQSVLKLQEIVRSGAMSREEACQAIKRELTSRKKVIMDPDPFIKGKKIIELLLQSNLISQEDNDIAHDIQKKHGGNIDNILIAAGKIREKTWAAACECERLLTANEIKLEQAIIALNYCERSRVSLAEAIDELGWS